MQCRTSFDRVSLGYMPFSDHLCCHPPHSCLAMPGVSSVAGELSKLSHIRSSADVLSESRVSEACIYRKQCRAATAGSPFQPFASLCGSSGISHSSSKSCAEYALSAGSQTSIRRMKLRNLLFSSPGGKTVTKSSSDAFGIGTSQIHSPEEVSHGYLACVL